jgi:hypothetical protein
MPSAYEVDLILVQKKCGVVGDGSRELPSVNRWQLSVILKLPELKKLISDTG